MKVIDMEDYRPVWVTDNATCSECGYKWMAVCHKDNTNKLECGECGAMAGTLNLEENNG